MIPLHPSDTLQMSEHAAHHTRHPSNRFEKNETNKPFSLSHIKLVCDFFVPFGISIPSHEISAPSKQTYQAQGDLVRKAFGFAMSYSDISNLLLCIFLVDEYLRVKGTQGVWALGDCTATRYSATGQVAHQEGAYLAQFLNKADANAGEDMARAQLPPPFEYTHQGSLAYVGDGCAIADLSVFGKNMPFAGALTHILWHIAYIKMCISCTRSPILCADYNDIWTDAICQLGINISLREIG